VIADPQARGAALADFFGRVSPALWGDLVASGLLAADDERASREWSCFALLACVRGMVAAGGFNARSKDAIDAFHAAVLEQRTGHDPVDEPIAPLVAERYAEYEPIAQAGGKSGADSVALRLGERAASHVGARAGADAELAAALGDLYEALAEGAAESVRRGGA